jgi:hypothetical protein
MTRMTRMTIPTFCIYSGKDPYVLLYDGKVEKKHMDDIEKVINSSKWKEMNTQVIRIDYDSTTEFFCRIMAKYVYIVVCDNTNGSKIYELIDKINNFAELLPNKNFYSYSEKFDSIIETFVKQVNPISKLQGQIKEVTTTMTDTIAITFDRQNKIENLEQKTIDLNSSAKDFERGAIVLKRGIQCSNIKITLIIAFVIILVIVIIALIAVQQ